MFNEGLWILFALINFSMLIVCYKLFGKTGLFAWIAASTIIANIQVVKTVELFTMIATLGNIMYGTIFLATDILNEKYGEKEAKKSVVLGFFILLVMTVIMQFALRFIPHEFDISQDSLQTIFGLQVRIALGSLAAFLISQFIDVKIYSFIKSKLPDVKYLWVRNNASTMTSQLLDTFIFCSIAFLGVFPMNEWIGIFISTYILKWIVSLMDTPFVYIAKKMNPTD